MAGMLRIRRYRIASTPLRALPFSLRLAHERVRASASFSLSADMKSPATVGLLRPVILLPQSFMSLRSTWQHGIACHELLHVRRRDWAVTVIEEVVAAVFWFHPGVWWLLAQSRLAREQIVDAEVVRLTSARKEYVASLLAMAGIRLEMDLSPAPLFLRKHHLTHRMHSLLEEVSMSKLRLALSYTAMAAILAAAGWAMFLLFPLEGQAESPSVQPGQSAGPSNAGPLTVPGRPRAITPQNAPPPPPPPPPPHPLLRGRKVFQVE